MELYAIPNSSEKSYVVHGATLKCSLGTSTCNLQIPVSHGVFLKGKKQANIDDYKSMTNILPFGSCLRTSPPPPCIPAVVMKWINGKENTTIEHDLALLNTSIAVCSKGGVISIVEDGQE